ncbi:MAG: hypothetical protein ACRD99_03460 [Nitrososphaera sp.]
MNIAFIVKSRTNGMKLSIYDENLSLLESETFSDLYTLNFHLQTLAKKYKISKGLMVVHDVDKNKVDLAIAEGDVSFYVD